MGKQTTFESHVLLSMSITNHQKCNSSDQGTSSKLLARRGRENKQDKVAYLQVPETIGVEPACLDVLQQMQTHPNHQGEKTTSRHVRLRLRGCVALRVSFLNFLLEGKPKGSPGAIAGCIAQEPKRVRSELFTTEQPEGRRGRGAQMSCKAEQMKIRGKSQP